MIKAAAHTARMIITATMPPVPSNMPVLPSFFFRFFLFWFLDFPVFRLFGFPV